MIKLQENKPFSDCQTTEYALFDYDNYHFYKLVDW